MGKKSPDRANGQSPNRNFEVGYCKPPKSGQFKPGQSGNPRGSRRKPESVTDQIRRILNKKITVTEAGKQRRMTLQEVMLTKLANNAANGDLKAFSVILDLQRTHEDQPSSTIDTSLLAADSQALIDTFLSQQNIGEESVDANSDREASRIRSDEDCEANLSPKTPDGDHSAADFGPSAGSGQSTRSSDPGGDDDG